MKDLKELVKDVERDLVINLIISLRHKRISPKEAKDISKDFLSTSIENHQDFFNSLYLLSNRYKEIRKAYVKYSPSFYEESDRISLEKLRQNNYGKN